MRNASIHPIVAALVFAAIPCGLWAQWPPHPTPGVPKLADGKPDLDGPAPRTADGKPDFSGVWEFVDAFRGQSGAGTTPPAGIGQGGRPIGPNQFFDIGSGIKGGLPFTPWAAALRKERTDNNNKDNPDAHCLPLGLMQLHTHPQPRKMIQTPTLLLITYEANSGLRQIFMDGRPLPGNDAEPWWYGYSIGHWEGDTLVVQTTGLRDDVWLDVEGSPLTGSGKVTERFRRPNFGHLEIEVTVEDPKAYTKPWTVRIADRIMLNTELLEFICNENERSDDHLVGK
jgi:hypothetical protein